MSGKYEAAIQFLYERINYEKTGHPTYNSANYRLARMRRLLDLLGNPQLAYDIVHVAGTKGKGSTSHFVSELLQAGGLLTGLYTSPHLLKLEERIRVAGQPCSNDELVELADRMRWAVERLEDEGAGRATFFELTTAMGMLHFAAKKVDMAVLEVGLGGRLDSTNVCLPRISVITAIGIDHQAQLGGTIAEIAFEKAGIIKPQVPVVCSARDETARKVITSRADELGCPLRMIERDFYVDWQASQASPDTSQEVAELTYKSSYSKSKLGHSHWKLSMLGSHQADNAGAALATVDWLMQNGRAIAPDQLKSALASAQVPARVQIVGQNPLQIIDVAHNSDSIRATIRTLREHFSGRKVSIVFASSRDKDYRTMLQIILENCDALIVTQYHKNPRALPTAELFQVASDVHRQLELEGLAARNKLPASTAAINLGFAVQRISEDLATGPRIDETASAIPARIQPTVRAIDNPVDAWRFAVQHSVPEGLVIGTGSFFLAAELLADSPQLFATV